MAVHRFSEDDLWAGVRKLNLTQAEFTSVVRQKRYAIVALDENRRSYVVKYESGNTKTIPISDLFAVYCELYRLGRMLRGYLRIEANGRRILGHTRYSHAPGATIYAIMPKLDDAIRTEKGGHLSIRGIP